MKTQYYTAASLDGFIATEDDSLDWLGGGKPVCPRRVLGPALGLMSVRQMGSGLVELRYELRKSA